MPDLSRPWWFQWLKFRRCLLPGTTGGPGARGRDLLTLHVLLDGAKPADITVREDAARGPAIPSIYA